MWLFCTLACHFLYIFFQSCSHFCCWLERQACCAPSITAYSKKALQKAINHRTAQSRLGHGQVRKITLHICTCMRNNEHCFAELAEKRKALLTIYTAHFPPFLPKTKKNNNIRFCSFITHEQMVGFCSLVGDPFTLKKSVFFEWNHLGKVFCGR